MSIRFSIAHKIGSFHLNAKCEALGAGITSIIGPSGCGKTTLLRCLAGLEKSAKGEIALGDEYWISKYAKHFLPAHRRHIGYVFQHAALFPHLSVAGNLDYAIRRAPFKQIPKEEAIELTGISKLLHRSTIKLSGGERQRVAIARTLLSSPKLLLLDEPLASLDIESKQNLLDHIERIRDRLNIPMIYVSHSMNEVVRLSNEVLRMEAGEIVSRGSSDTLVNDQTGAFRDRDDPLSLIQGTIVSRDPEFDIATLRFCGGSIQLPGCLQDVDTQIRVAIWARDVSLARHEPSETSILNCLPCTVQSIENYDPAKSLVTLDCNGLPLRSLITKKSVHDLKLSPQTSIFALIKAASLAD